MSDAASMIARAAHQRLLRDPHHDVLARSPAAALPCEIESLAVLDGWLPPRALRLVAEWGELHREELRNELGSRSRP
jgi:hypothetical protein